MVTILQDLIGRIPGHVDTLYIQVDGCSDNINDLVMMYLQMLVQEGRFAEIQLHRLPVGHTHEDIGELKEETKFLK